MATRPPSGTQAAGASATQGASPESVQAGYERKDIDVRTLAKLGIWLAVVLVVIFFAMKWTFSFYAETQKLGPPVSPFEGGDLRVLPPAPRLQVAPTSDLRVYCNAEHQALTTYGWADKPTGAVRVPVDRAMQMLLERGLPVRPGSQPPADAERIAQKSQSGAIDAGPCGYLLRADAAKKPADMESGAAGTKEKE